MRYRWWWYIGKAAAAAAVAERCLLLHVCWLPPSSPAQFCRLFSQTWETQTHRHADKQTDTQTLFKNIEKG